MTVGQERGGGEVFVGDDKYNVRAIGDRPYKDNGVEVREGPGAGGMGQVGCHHEILQISRQMRSIVYIP